MSIQNRISVTLSPRMKKALELVAGVDGSTTATYASQLLSAAIKNEIKDSPVLYEKWLQLERQAMKHDSWDDIVSPMTIPRDEQQETQKGWVLSGDNPDGYIVGTDKTVTYKNAASGFIRSKRNDIGGFGTLMQQTDITQHIGKRLRISASLKTQDVKNWAALWARIDDKDFKVLWFDNMQDRPIKGTTNWNKYEIGFEVPEESTTLNFGVLLVGPGNVWANNLNLVELKGDEESLLEDLQITLDF